MRAQSFTIMTLWASLGGAALAAAAPAGNHTDEIAHIPSIELPPSVYVSEATNKALLDRAAIEPPTVYSKENIAEIRRVLDGFAAPFVEDALKIFPAVIARKQIAEVWVSVVTPKAGVPAQNRHRALIELHAGALLMGADYGVEESTAIAEVGKFKVFSVEYRLTPESKFPAASEDVTKVYRELLKSYAPQNIGIFGSSAGGLLTAEVVAWLQRQNLPRPGAIGIFGSGADARFDGDSRYTNPASGFNLAPNEQVVDFMLKSYFGSADLKDPLISPVWSPDVLSKFPPTLLVTSTRAHEMSSAIFTHQQLLKSGVVTDIRIWDGLPHCFYMLVPGSPESRDVFDTVTKFFDAHLGSVPKLGS